MCARCGDQTAENLLPNDVDVILEVNEGVIVMGRLRERRGHMRVALDHTFASGVVKGGGGAIRCATIVHPDGEANDALLGVASKVGGAAVGGVVRGGGSGGDKACAQTSRHPPKDRGKTVANTGCSSCSP